MASEFQTGSVLKSRRQQLGISLDQASRDTNMRAKMLELLESSEYSKYPPHGHAVGMISSYARYLGLDSRMVVEQFDAEYQSWRASSSNSSLANALHQRTSRNKVASGGRDESRTTRRKSSASIAARDREVPRETSSRMNRSIRDQRDAESDSRQQTGSVKVVGKRQTGSFGRIGSSRREQAHYTSLREREGQHDTGTFRSRSASAKIGTTGSGRFEASSSGRISSNRSRTDGAVRPDYSSGEMPTSETDTGTAPLSASARMRAAGKRTTRTSRVYSQGSTSRSSRRGASRSLRDGDKTERHPNFFGVDVGPGETAARSSSRRRRSRSRRAESNAASSKPRPDENIVDRLLRILSSIFSERRTRIIAILLIVIVLGVIIAASMLISTAGNGNGGLIEVQGGAINDTTTTDDGNSAHKTITTANGNPVTIKIEVAQGETCLMYVTFDDANAYSGTVIGYYSREFPVTESFSATFGNPDAVTVSENGNVIEIAKNNDGTGILNIDIQAAASATS